MLVTAYILYRYIQSLKIKDRCEEVILDNKEPIYLCLEKKKECVCS